MPSQAAPVKKRFAATEALLRSSTVMTNVINQMRLFHVTRAALSAGVRSSPRRQMAGRQRIPVTGSRHVAAQVTDLHESLAAVPAGVTPLYVRCFELPHVTVNL